MRRPLLLILYLVTLVAAVYYYMQWSTTARQLEATQVELHDARISYGDAIAANLNSRVEEISYVYEDYLNTGFIDSLFTGIDYIVEYARNGVIDDKKESYILQFYDSTANYKILDEVHPIDTAPRDSVFLGIRSRVTDRLIHRLFAPVGRISVFWIPFDFDIEGPRPSLQRGDTSMVRVKIRFQEPTSRYKRIKPTEDLKVINSFTAEANIFIPDDYPGHNYPLEIHTYDIITGKKDNSVFNLAIVD